MLSETVIRDIKNLISRFMENGKYRGYEVEIRGQPNVGENFVGEVVFVRILSKNGDDIHDFIVKTAKRSESLRKKFPVVSQYRRELFVYSEVFPTFRKFLDEVNPDFSFDFVAKDHWVCTDENHETLILDDLRSAGYRMLDPKKTWNLEHSLFVMEKYGKFHAISFALRDQKPEIFARLTQNMASLHCEYGAVVDMQKYMNEVLESNMILLKESGRKDLYDKFDLLRKEVRDVIDNVVEMEDKMTICHGDCWNNNFMFEYQDEKDTSRPINVKFLDFQLAMFHSPVADISLNIYSTCDKNVLEHFDLLLETYYNSLSTSIESLGSDPATLFTFKELRRHWRRYGLFGLLFARIAIKYSLFTSDETPDFVEISEGKKDFNDCLTYQGKNEAECNQRLLGIFTHFGDTFL